MSLISGVLADFALAWRLLTIIPLPFLPTAADRPAGWAAAYYPLVGLMLGLALAGAGQLFFFSLPPGLAAALLLALWAGLTGLLHLDGFMDSCDGLLPPRDPARRLEIMKDSRVGAFGVVGVILLLLIKFNALAALPPAYRMPALIVIPALARWAMTWAMARYPLARREGTSVFFSAGLGWRQVIAAALIAGAAALILMNWWGVVMLVLTWLVMTRIARLAMTRIAGLTGDVYGAICEVTETVLLAVVVVF
ncbi:MAG: adenosylcobinamide-GDP ribazoletransferase [Chloroflexota bacterium]|nr:MAG: adenosylcobinamide-GDP ribazoletransferase [Chloroflexota bacterium]